MVVTGKRPLEDGLVLDLRLNEGIGSVAHDVSGKRNHGAFVGAPTWVDSEAGFGKALSFNGIGDRLDILDEPSLDIVTDLGIVFKIKFIAERVEYASYPIEKYVDTDNANLRFYHFGTTAGAQRYTIRFYATRGGVWGPISPSYIVTLGIWYRIGLSYNSVLGGQLYINGAPYGDRGGGGNLTTNNANLEIGSSDESIIDEIRIWNRAPSDEEFLLDYAQRGRI